MSCGYILFNIKDLIKYPSSFLKISINDLTCVSCFCPFKVNVTSVPWKSDGFPAPPDISASFVIPESFNDFTR